MDLSCRWRADFADPDVDALHAEGFGHPPRHDDWRAQVERYSLGWVCAYDQHTLVGFVNVAWDGGAHAFLLDTLVAATHRHQGIGSALVEVAAREAQAAGSRGSTWTSNPSSVTSTSAGAASRRPRPASSPSRDARRRAGTGLTPCPAPARSSS